MNILAFVDTHNMKKELNIVLNKAKKADILVCAGDISWFGQDLNKILKKFAKLGKIMLIIHGNHEDPDELRKLCMKYNNIRFVHKKTFRMKGKMFVAYGGGGFSREDKRFEMFIKEVKKRVKKGEEIVLITHGPPYKTKIDELYGDYVGNESYNKAIKSLKPLLYICGHIHENSKAKQVIGNTLVIHPGEDGEILKI